MVCGQESRIAANARWGRDLFRATHEGPLQIADAEIFAAVLPNGKRLLSQGTFLMAIGRSRTPKAGTGGLSTVDTLPFFLQAETLKPFVTQELMMSTTPIFFLSKSVTKRPPARGSPGGNDDTDKTYRSGEANSCP